LGCNNNPAAWPQITTILFIIKNITGNSKRQSGKNLFSLHHDVFIYIIIELGQQWQLLLYRQSTGSRFD
jgi:hypothetical protein